MSSEPCLAAPGPAWQRAGQGVLTQGPVTKPGAQLRLIRPATWGPAPCRLGLAGRARSKLAPLLHFGLCAHTLVCLWQSVRGATQRASVRRARGGLRLTGFWAARPTPGSSAAGVSPDAPPFGRFSWTSGTRGRSRRACRTVRARRRSPRPRQRVAKALQAGPGGGVSFASFYSSCLTVQGPRGSPFSCKRGQTP